MFELEQFIADLRGSLAERSRQAMREIVARAVADPGTLLRGIRAPETPGGQILYQGPDLTVINVAWAPQQITLPHNHMMTAVIGMYSGREDNLYWRRVADPQRYQIEAAGGQALGAGDVAILGRDIIHSVVNPLSRISGAIHVYDGDFFGVARSMWDPETLAEAPYDFNAVAKGTAITR